MANEDHVALLKQGVEVWNRWRTDNGLVTLDLNGADLRRANLAGANLVRVELRGTGLVGANLIEADLSGADLVEADFTEADLSGADLSVAFGRAASCASRAGRRSAGMPGGRRVDGQTETTGTGRAERGQ